MSEHKEPIPSMIYNASVGGHVTNSQQIIDENENKEQSQINAEVKETLGQGGSVDTRIDQAKTDIIGGASSSGNTLKKIEDRVSPLEDAVGSGGSVDSRIAAAKTDIKGTATSACDTLGKAEALILTEATARTNAVSAETSRAQTAEENLRTLYNNLQKSQPIPVTALPATGEVGKIYRLAGTNSYADYMYAEGALTTPIKMAEYDNAIDDAPITMSNNLVKSGGVNKFTLKRNGLYLNNVIGDYSAIKYIAIRPLAQSLLEKTFCIYAYSGDAQNNLINIWVRTTESQNACNFTIDVSSDIKTGNPIKRYTYEDSGVIIYLEINIEEALNAGTVVWGSNGAEIAKVTEAPKEFIALTPNDDVLYQNDILETNAKNVANKTISQGFYTTDKLREKGVDFYSQVYGTAYYEPAGIDGIIECRIAYKNPSIFSDPIHFGVLGINNADPSQANAFAIALCNDVNQNQYQWWIMNKPYSEIKGDIITVYAEDDKLKFAIKLNVAYLKQHFIHYAFSNPAYIITGILDKNDSYWAQFDNTSGINIAVIGDSITSGDNWPKYAADKLLAATLNNCAHGGGHFEDLSASYQGVTYYPQEYTDPNFAGYKAWGSIASAEDAQAMANDCSRTMVSELIAKVTNGDYPVPDIVVFAMGTNDTRAGVIEDIFEEGDYNDMSDAVRATCGGAARWAIQKVKQTYPNCKIYVSLPIQSRMASHNTKNQDIISILKEVCYKLSVPIINSYNECGISYYDELLYTDGHYLIDEIHPNDLGKKLLGEYISNKIISVQ